MLNSAKKLQNSTKIGEKILAEAIKAPFYTIMENAGIENYNIPNKNGVGYNVICGKEVNMIESGIVDPVLVTKTALKNAVSVVSTIISADCVINNIRIENASS